MTRGGERGHHLRYVYTSADCQSSRERNYHVIFCANNRQCNKFPGACYRIFCLLRLFSAVKYQIGRSREKIYFVFVKKTRKNLLQTPDPYAARRRHRSHFRHLRLVRRGEELGQATPLDCVHRAVVEPGGVARDDDVVSLLGGEILLRHPPPASAPALLALPALPAVTAPVTLTPQRLRLQRKPQTQSA